jgi:YVTN family beta-propeller protein
MSRAMSRIRRTLLMFAAVVVVFLCLFQSDFYACDFDHDDNDHNPVEAMPRGIAINPNTSQAVYTSKNSNSVKIYDLITREIITTVHVGREPEDVAIDCILNLALVSNSKDNTVSLLDLSRFHVISTIKTGNSPAGISINQKNHIAVVTNLRDNTISLIDLNIKQVIATVQTGKHPVDAAIYNINDNESIGLVVNRMDRDLSVIDMEEYKPINTFNAYTTPRTIDINPETGLAVITNVLANTITVVDLHSFLLRVIKVGRHPIDAAFNTVDNRAVVICDEDNKLYLVDVTANKTINTYNLHTHMRGVAVDSKLNLAAVIDADSDKLILIQLPYATAAPTIAITAPQNNAVINAPTITVTGTTTNAKAVTVNNAPALISGNNFSAQIVLKEGVNTIIATATDAYGRTASQSINITAHAKLTITGNVSNSLTALPVSLAAVAVTDVTNRKQTVLTDANGNYAINDVAAGDFTGTISKQWYTTYNFAKSQSADLTVTINTALVPLPPIISNVAAKIDNALQALITWTTDQPSDSKVEYSTPYYGTAYGGAEYDATLTVSHSILLTQNIFYSDQYQFTLKSTGENGATGTSSDNQFTTPEQINLWISAPQDGATVIDSSITVYGWATNTSGNEMSVKVNGVTASVVSGNFVAFNVPLTLGANTITVIATDIVTGSTATQAITVNSSAVVTGNYFKVSATPQSGVGPLTVTLRFSSTFPRQNTKIYTGFWGEYQVVDGLDEYNVQLNAPGLYSFTVSAQDPNGVTYRDTVTVLVMSLPQIDTLLRSKWTILTNALLAGDTTTALTVMEAARRPNYRIVFNLLKDQWPDIISTYQGFYLISIGDGTAKYKLTALKKGKIYAYEIQFIRDADGLWYIREF